MLKAQISFSHMFLNKSPVGLFFLQNWNLKKAYFYCRFFLVRNFLMFYETDTIGWCIKAALLSLGKYITSLLSATQNLGCYGVFSFSKYLLRWFFDC